MNPDVLQRRYSCAVELALDVIGGKWKAVILAHLKEQPRRYGELRKLAPRMSEKMLTQRLGELVHAGLVRRSDATYELTPSALELAPALEALYRWGLQVAHEHDVELTPD